MQRYVFILFLPILPVRDVLQLTGVAPATDDAVGGAGGLMTRTVDGGDELLSAADYIHIHPKICRILRRKKEMRFEYYLNIDGSRTLA